MGKGIEKREKGEILIVLGRKNMILEKGGGQKYSIFGKYIPLFIDATKKSPFVLLKQFPN